MTEQPSRRSAVCVFALGASLVATAAVCLWASSDTSDMAMYRHSRHKSRSTQHLRSSPACTNCMDRIQELRHNEHAAVENSMQRCDDQADMCDQSCYDFDKDCIHSCASALHDCRHQVHQAHEDHLSLHGLIEDQHQCRRVCTDISPECDVCLTEEHHTRFRMRQALRQAIAACREEANQCSAECYDDDKDCIHGCTHAHHECHSAAWYGHREHLTLHDQINDHHQCRDICKAAEHVNAQYV
mmetsp:Transcript_28350/g.83248  ORF Transcript_28350/g.83248 Transcript_28350/m.83248 type:complete len:242 (+) Transcript_28350:56-781(+)